MTTSAPSDLTLPEIASRIASVVRDNITAGDLDPSWLDRLSCLDSLAAAADAIDCLDDELGVTDLLVRPIAIWHHQDGSRFHLYRDGSLYCTTNGGNTAWDDGTDFARMVHDEFVRRMEDDPDERADDADLALLRHYHMTPAMEEVDMNDADMPVHTVDRDNLPALRFRGELLAEVSSNPDQAHPDYSRSTGRWCELRLYRTAAGRYVAEEVGCTQWEKERDRSRAEVCADLDAVQAFLGSGWLAKLLYEAAGIDHVEEVD